MAELVAGDAVVLGHDGAVVAAYPFSATPTLHRVAVDGGPRVYAMCAVDALGMSAMLARPVTIAAREPDTDLQIRVRVDGEQATFEPPTTVVYAGTTGKGCCGRAAQQRCGTINFFTTAYARHHPTVADPNIGSVALLRPAAITHHTDAGARYIRLAITGRGGGQIVARAPASTNVAPPGWYLLFVVSNRGVPSVGRFIQVQ